MAGAHARAYTRTGRESKWHLARIPVLVLDIWGIPGTGFKWTAAGFELVLGLVIPGPEFKWPRRPGVK